MLGFFGDGNDGAVPPGFFDSAIAEFIHNFHKSLQIFLIALNVPQILGLDARLVTLQRAFSQRKFVSQCEK